MSPSATATSSGAMTVTAHPRETVVGAGAGPVGHLRRPVARRDPGQRVSPRGLVDDAVSSHLDAVLLEGFPARSCAHEVPHAINAAPPAPGTHALVPPLEDGRRHVPAESSRRLIAEGVAGDSGAEASERGDQRGSRRSEGDSRTPATKRTAQPGSPSRTKPRIRGPGAGFRDGRCATSSTTGGAALPPPPPPSCARGGS